MHQGKHQVVLISGKMGSGKTTISNLLVQQFDDQAETEAINTTFAHPLYEIHNYARELLRAYNVVRPNKDGALLQLIGTEWGRNTIDKDIWVKVCKTRVETFQSLNKNSIVVISDVRFPNELEAFPDALKVRLECPRDVRKQRCDGWRENENHPSEVSLDNMYEKFDLILDTNHLDPYECVGGVMRLLK